MSTYTTKYECSGRLKVVFSTHLIFFFIIWVLNKPYHLFLYNMSECSKRHDIFSLDVKKSCSALILIFFSVIWVLNTPYHFFLNNMSAQNVMSCIRHTRVCIIVYIQDGKMHRMPYFGRSFSAKEPYFHKKSLVISGSFAERDLRLRASCASSPFCNCTYATTGQRAKWN